jgi:hypothetical protein
MVATKNSTAVVFSEQSAPVGDSGDDCIVAYRAVFEPLDLDQGAARAVPRAGGEAADER